MKRKKVQPGTLTGNATCFCGKTIYDLEKIATGSDAAWRICEHCQDGPTFRVSEETIVKKSEASELRNVRNAQLGLIRQLNITRIADVPIGLLRDPVPGQCDLCGETTAVRDVAGVAFCTRCAEHELPIHETNNCGRRMHYEIRSLSPKDESTKFPTLVEVCVFCSRFRRVQRYEKVIRFPAAESVSVNSEVGGVRVSGTFTLDSVKKTGHVVVCPACDGRILCIKLGEHEDATSTIICGSCATGSRVTGVLLQPMTTLSKREDIDLDTFRARNALHTAEIVTKPVHTIPSKETEKPRFYEKEMVFLHCPECRISFPVNPREPHEQGKTLCKDCDARSVQIGPFISLPIPRHPRAPVKKVVIAKDAAERERRIRAGERRAALAGVLEMLSEIDLDPFKLTSPRMAWRKAVSLVREYAEKWYATAERIETGTEKIIAQCPRCEWINSEPREYCRRCAWPDTPTGNAYAHGCKTSEGAELWDAEYETKILPSIQIERRHTFVQPQTVNGRTVGICSCGWPTCGNVSQAAWNRHRVVSVELLEEERVNSSSTQGEAPGEAENPFGEKAGVVECERPHSVGESEAQLPKASKDRHNWLPTLSKKPLTAHGSCSCGFGLDDAFMGQGIGLETWLEHRTGRKIPGYIFTSGVFTPGLPEFDGHVWRPTEPGKVDSWGRCACGWPTGAEPYTADVCPPLHFAAHLANVLEEKAHEVAKPLSAPGPGPQKVLEEKAIASVLLDGEKVGTLAVAEAPDFEKTFGDPKELSKQIAENMKKDLGCDPDCDFPHGDAPKGAEHLWVSDPDFPMSGVCSCGWPSAASDVGRPACKDAWQKHRREKLETPIANVMLDGKKIGTVGITEAPDFEKMFGPAKDLVKEITDKMKGDLLGKPHEGHDLIEDDEFYRCSCGKTGFSSLQEWGGHVSEMILTWSERNPGVLTTEPTFRDLVLTKLGAIEGFVSKLEHVDVDADEDAREIARLKKIIEDARKELLEGGGSGQSMRNVATILSEGVSRRWGPKWGKNGPARALSGRLSDKINEAVEKTLPWNHCPRCHDTIDADDVHDGSELHCHACTIDLVVVEMDTDPTTWTLISREQEDDEPKGSPELAAAFKHLNTRMKESKGKGFFNVDRKHIEALLAELKRFEG